MAESDPEVTFNHPRVGEGDQPIEYNEDKSESEVDTEESEAENNTRQASCHVRKRSPRTNVINVKPETYNGDGDWEVYLNHFELCAELGQWSPREKALTLAASLRGQAQFYYVTLSKLERSAYNLLTDRLSQRFGRSRQQPMWMTRLESRKRYPDEPIAQLADDLISMAQRAYPDMNRSAQENLALNQLYKSINPELRFKCITENCRTMNQAVALVEMFEGVVESSNPNKKKGAVHMVTGQAETSGQNETNTSNLETAVRELQDMVRQLMQSRGTNGPNQTPKRCYNCQSTQHFKRNCPFLRNNTQNQYSQPPSTNFYQPSNPVNSLPSTQ